MNKEEAIKTIQKFMGWFKPDSRIYKALEMAIQALNSLEEVYAKGYNDGFTQAEVNFENDKALSQEPCRYWQNGKCNGNTEVCEDAVNRDTALEKMADYVASGYAESVKDFEEYSKIICQLPSVTQKSDKYRKEAKRWKNKWLKSQKMGKYTADELRVFADGISLSLCSKKSAQHWSYDEKTAEQIRWLECLHSKVKTDIADMNCGAKMESEVQTDVT